MSKYELVTITEVKNSKWPVHIRVLESLPEIYLSLEETKELRDKLDEFLKDK